MEPEAAGQSSHEQTRLQFSLVGRHWNSQTGWGEKPVQEYILAGSQGLFMQPLMPFKFSPTLNAQAVSEC